MKEPAATATLLCTPAELRRHPLDSNDLRAWQSLADELYRQLNAAISERDRAIEREAVLGTTLREFLEAWRPVYEISPEGRECIRRIEAALSTTGGGLIGALREIAAPKPGAHWSDIIHTHQAIAKRALAGVGL